MNKKKLHSLLTAVKNGTCDIDSAVQNLQTAPLENLQEACVDHQRALRTGFPEVIYGASKTPRQIIEISKSIRKKDERVIATRVNKKKAKKICSKLSWLDYHANASILTGNIPTNEKAGRGNIAIVCAGTSDLPVAEEAAVTAKSLGHQVTTIYDVGVAGLHRIFHHGKSLSDATVIIVVAGMEGALPSVIGGLVSAPVIAVPTSVGYGANLGGLTALLGMLNSCAPGVAVVNIDNGFGAACMAVAINC